MNGTPCQHFWCALSSCACPPSCVFDRAQVRSALPPALITSLMKRVQTCQELDSFVTLHEAALNEIHVSAALSILVKLRHDRLPDGGLGPEACCLMDRLLGILQSSQPGLGARIDLLEPARSATQSGVL